MEELEKVLKLINAPILNILNDGIDIKVKNEVFPSNYICDDLETLYKWKNGTNLLNIQLIGNAWLIYMGSFISFDRAQTIYQSRAGEDKYWSSSMFPIFESLGGEFHLIECNMENIEFGSIYYHSIGDIDFETIIKRYDSLESLFNTVTECYVSQIHTFDEKGLLITNLEKAIQIGKKNNPQSGFWNLFDDN